MTPKEIARDKRLKKTYGISLSEYNELLAFQGGVCAICGRVPKEMPLNVDHFHYKINCEKIINKDTNTKHWRAITVIDGIPYENWNITKERSVSYLKSILKRVSVRGLLCPGRHRGCNRLLGRIDNTNWLDAAKKYLENPPARKVLK